MNNHTSADDISLKTIAYEFDELKRYHHHLDGLAGHVTIRPDKIRKFPHLSRLSEQHNIENPLTNEKRVKYGMYAFESMYLKRWINDLRPIVEKLIPPPRPVSIPPARPVIEEKEEVNNLDDLTRILLEDDLPPYFFTTKQEEELVEEEVEDKTTEEIEEPVEEEVEDKTTEEIKAQTLYRGFGILSKFIRTIPKHAGKQWPEDNDVQCIISYANTLNISIPSPLTNESGKDIVQFRQVLLREIGKTNPEIQKAFIMITQKKVADHYKNSIADQAEVLRLQIMNQIETDFGNSTRKIALVAVITTLLSRIESIRRTQPDLLKTGFTFGPAQRGFNLNNRTVKMCMDYAVEKLGLVKRIKRTPGTQQKYVIIQREE